MSRFVGDQLNDGLRSRLSVDRAIEHGDRAIVICTIDEHGWPHPAMVSSLELLARDARNVRFALHARSRSASNLTANGRLTLVIVDEGSVHYVKGDALPMAPAAAMEPELTRFNLRVDSVLEDIAADYEHARVTGSIRVERQPADPAAIRARLDALLAD